MIKNFLLDLIFPRFCLGCQKEIAPKQTSLICESCFNKITKNCGLNCHICGLRTNLGVCRKCRSKTHINGLYVAGFYHDPILREMIHCFKYNSIESLKTPLAKLMIYYITQNQLTDRFKNCVLVPIPLTLRRRINRGFNQSEILALEISKYLNLGVANLLKRKSFSIPQVNISDWQKRKENISGVFCLSKPQLLMSDINSTIDVGHQYNCRYKKMILVDDVSTSGATLEEAARVLKKAGIKEVYGLVIARG